MPNNLEASAKAPRFCPTLAFWPSAPDVLPPVRVHGQAGLALPDEFVIREFIDAPDFATLANGYGTPDTPDLFAFAPDVIRRGMERSRFSELRSAARFWLASALRDEAAALNAPVPEGDPPYSSMSEGAALMQEAINNELSGYSLRLVTVAADGTVAPYVPHLDVLQVAALQLAMLATDGRRAQRCANEPCGRGFVRQRSTRRKTIKNGDFAGTAHAAGVRYCSAECGKAQQARERRRRQRAETGPAS